MSRLFEYFIDKVFVANPYAYQEHLERQLHANEQFYYHVRDEWIAGIRTPLTHSIKEWIWAGKPTPKVGTINC